jgi:molybdate transport system substrate-binding protein
MLNQFFRCLLLSVFTCLFTSAEGQQKTLLRVAAAANVQFALEEIVPLFEKETGTKVELNIGSSGKLTTQIAAGAPFHVFISADTDYPDTLVKMGQNGGKPQVYAVGSLVLWSTNVKSKAELGTDFLKRANFKKLAVANPLTAPYGRAAMLFLKSKKLSKLLQSKLVQGESIAQTNQYILSGACDAGITAKSSVRVPAMQGKGHWIDLTGGYPPIRQAALVTKYGKTQFPAASKAFVSFLLSTKAREIWARYGYAKP